MVISTDAHLRNHEYRMQVIAERQTNRIDVIPKERTIYRILENCDNPTIVGVTLVNNARRTDYLFTKYEVHDAFDNDPAKYKEATAGNLCIRHNGASILQNVPHPGLSERGDLPAGNPNTGPFFNAMY